ncbi:NYN domain-containing protein [Microbacterium lacticum]
MFVDFDNVYSGLQRLDGDAAKSFAEDPARWVESFGTGSDADGPFTRRFLVRKCYLNPATFSRYRPHFTRAGFQVVDCPSLTQQGKSSADINLVLDAVDALNASTHFDEFIFLSADADFTPLIARCRAADRHVTIITSGPAAAAYRAAADSVLGADALITLLTAAESNGSDAAPLADDAPPVTSALTVAPSTIAPPTRVAAMSAVRHLAESSPHPVALSAAAAAALRAEPDLRESSWDNSGSFSSWLQSSLPDLRVDTRAPGHVWDPARFSEADVPIPPEPSVTRTPDQEELHRQVSSITEVPPLSQASYRALLEQLAFDLALYPFSRTETSKRVRDECAQSDRPVGRAAVNFVINGLLFAGADLEGEPSASDLAAVWSENVLGLCRGARIELSAEDLDEVTTWVSGGLVAVVPTNM